MSLRSLSFQLLHPPVPIRDQCEGDNAIWGICLSNQKTRTVVGYGIVSKTEPYVDSLKSVRGTPSDIESAFSFTLTAMRLFCSNEK